MSFLQDEDHEQDQESKIRGQKEGKINGLVRLGAEMEA